MGGAIQIRASLAVLLIDDFTGKIIRSPSVRVQTKTGEKPVRKQEGFWVFTNLTEEEIHLVIEDVCYYREERLLSLKELDSRNPVVRIRLKPNRLCRLPVRTSGVMMELPEGAAVSLFQEQGSDHKKLLSDYKKGGLEIAIYQEEMEELEGKYCCIIDKSGKKEMFFIGRAKDRERGIYQLEQPLTQEYKKIGTKIFPVSFLQANASGEYFIPLKGTDKEDYTCIFEKKGKKREETIALKPQTQNQIRWQEP